MDEDSAIFMTHLAIILFFQGPTIKKHKICFESKDYEGTSVIFSIIEQSMADFII